MRYEAVVIGASAGGLQALRTVLRGLPADFPVPITVVQHRLASSGKRLCGLLDKACELSVRQAEEKELPRPGCVYVAPPNYHLLFEGDGTYSLSTDERVQHARPSIDVLFESAAETYGDRLIGVILTGANRDGSAGLARTKQAGGLAVVQDPATAEAAAMPRAALEATCVDRTAPLEEIAPLLVEFCTEGAA